MRLESVSRVGTGGTGTRCKRAPSGDAVFSRLPFHFLATTGINDPIPVDSKIKVYPNPGHSDFTLEWDSNSYGNVELTIFDVNGRQVERKMLSQAHGANRTSIDMSMVASGIYIGRILSTHGNFSFKWIKQ